MPRKFFRRYLPSHDSVRQHRLIARFGRLLEHPNLWHLNRRSVSGGVAIGLFSGLVPGPLQMLTAALLAIPLRRNLPVALLTTLYTNPFTIVPLYVIAYWIGSALVGDATAPMTQPPEFAWSHAGEWMHAMVDWALALGKPLAIGLVVLACGLAALGWVVVRVAWRAVVILQWRHRARRRRAG
jgi:uncharacterized protein (DUF2062 family)